MTLSISRWFTFSSASGGRTADGKFTFATSASYSCSTPTQRASRCRPYLRLHRALFLPPFNQAFADAVALLQETRNHAGHLPDAIITLDDRLVLVYNHGYALEERRQSSDVV
jgi:hypothetical protein